MRDWKKITVIFIVLMFISIGIYDVVAIINGGTEASISSTMIVWSYRFPLFPFLMGVICGHLFWRMRSNDDTLFIDKKDK